MSIVFGLLTLIASIIVPLALTYFADFQILNFSIFFVIPVGGIAVGYLCGFGYFKGLQISNTFITKKHLLISLLLALLCIFGIEYTSYRLTCMDPVTGEMVYSFDGEHISNYYIEGYGQLTFLNFKRFMVENTPITFSYRHEQIVDVTNPTWCWIFNFIDYLGVFIGCFMAASKQKDKPYCATCSSYKKVKDLFKIKKETDASFFEELKQRLASTDMGVSASELLNSMKIDNKNTKKQEYYLIKLIYCDKCRTASLKFVLFKANNKENLDFDYEIPFNYDYINTLTNGTVNVA